MNVQELIDQLQSVPDKTRRVVSIEASRRFTESKMLEVQEVGCTGEHRQEQAVLLYYAPCVGD